jgi:hypothetical protein
MEKRAEFSGMLGKLAWLGDGIRFAFTRIDDTRDEAGELANVPYWLKMSAVLYDSAEGVELTTVLKESTDTQNFRFDSVSGNDENFVIIEEYVRSPKDWGDEEKIKSRRIKVPVPAAGLWGPSAALYDPSDDDGCVILKRATAKESFTVTGMTDENEMTINVTSVKSEKDWEDPDKQQDAEIVVAVPAAG